MHPRVWSLFFSRSGALLELPAEPITETIRPHDWRSADGSGPTPPILEQSDAEQRSAKADKVTALLEYNRLLYSNWFLNNAIDVHRLFYAFFDVYRFLNYAIYVNRFFDRSFYKFGAGDHNGA